VTSPPRAVSSRVPASRTAIDSAVSTISEAVTSRCTHAAAGGGIDRVQTRTNATTSWPTTDSSAATADTGGVGAAATAGTTAGSTSPIAARARTIASSTSRHRAYWLSRDQTADIAADE
jgi:hypothetical protein